MKKLIAIVAVLTAAVIGSTVAAAPQNHEKIGYQSGIAASMNRLRLMDPAGKAAYDKLQRTLKILADDHDAGMAPAPAPTPTPTPAPTPPPPPAALPAPQTYNKGSRGQDARYCLPPGQTVDAAGYHYDENGLSTDGRRTGNPVPGLRPADEMNGQGPCEPYLGFPPWPAESYLP